MKNTLIYLLFASVLSTFRASPVADIYQGCPYNLPRDQYLHVHGGKCYEFLIHKHSTWQVAQNDCRSKGGNLVIVRNQADEQFIMNMLRSYNFAGQGVWIGLRNIGTSAGEQFAWVTGETTGFSYWAPGQPGSSHHRRRFLLDSLPEIHIPTLPLHLPTLPSIHLPHILPQEDCVLLKYTDSGHWHDYPCEKLDLIGLFPEHYSYVCEYSYQGAVTLKHTTTSSTQQPTTTSTTQQPTTTSTTQQPTTMTTTLEPTEVIQIG